MFDREAGTDDGQDGAATDGSRPSPLLGLVVALALGLGLSGWAIAGMAVWETQQPLFALAFVVVLPVSLTIGVRALRRIL